MSFEKVMSREDWDRIVDRAGRDHVDAHVKPETAKPYYSYDNFRKAAERYPAFYRGRRAMARRGIAAFLAHLYQESRFAYNHEIRCYDPPGSPCNDYGNTNWGARHNHLAPPGGCARAEWDCRYFGRGPMQLTWYLNYLDTSMAIFGDDRLAREPWLVAEDPVVGWTVALQFWMTNTGRERVTAHQAMRGGNFGTTISIINGDQECGRAWDSRAQTRVDTFLEYCRILGVDPPSPPKKLRC